MATWYQVSCDECLLSRNCPTLSEANQALFRHLSSRSHRVATNRYQTGLARYHVKHCDNCMGDRPHASSLGACLACTEVEAC